jgi:hypothetical protein
VKSDLIARVAYGIFYDGGLSSTAGWILDAIDFTVPDVTGDLYTNERFGVHADFPHLKFSDILPAPSKVDLCYPICTGTGTGYFDYPAYIKFADKDSWITPYYQRYLVEFQKGLGQNTVATLSYVGGRGTKLGYWENLNKPAYRTGWPDDTAFNSARPNNLGRFGDTKALRRGHNSFYNAVTLKFDRRLSAGLQLLAHYTFSKSVQDPSAFQAESLGLVNNEFDWNRRLGRGEADFSHPHRFVSVLSYQVPWGASLPRLAKAFVHGWGLSAVTTFESGNAATIYNGVTTARDYEPEIANVSGNPNLSHGERGFYRLFNTQAFSAPPQDVKGNAGFGIVRGPGLNNWDISLAKTFGIYERLKAQFRADFFNMFNHVQWRAGGSTFTYNDAANSTFGFATGAREPRIIQLGLRFTY